MPAGVGKLALVAHRQGKIFIENRTKNGQLVADRLLLENSADLLAAMIEGGRWLVAEVAFLKMPQLGNLDTEGVLEPRGDLAAVAPVARLERRYFPTKEDGLGAGGEGVQAVPGLLGVEQVEDVAPVNLGEPVVVQAAQHPDVRAQRPEDPEAAGDPAIAAGDRDAARADVQAVGARFHASDCSREAHYCRE